MKVKRIWRMLLTGIMFVTGICAYASAVTDVTFNSDGIIEEGDAYGNVTIEDTPPGHTTVNMSGGSAYNTFTYDCSTLNMTGGTTEVFAYDESTINVGGGKIYTLESYDSSTANLFGGYTYSATACETGTINIWQNGNLGGLFVEEDGIANMSNGAAKRVLVGDRGIVNLFGGLVSDKLWAGDSGRINIYGYGLSKASTGGHYGYGYVSGEWSDRTGFYIDLSGSETYSHIVLHEIPEPGTFVLTAAGCIALLRRWES